MAKEKAATTVKVILGIVAAVLLIVSTIWGIATASVAKSQIDKTQTGRITVVEIDIKSNERRLDKAELAQRDLIGINKSINSALIRIEASQGDQRKAQTKLAEDMAVVKTKVENLERSP